MTENKIIEKLSSYLSKFPSLGKRSAMKITLHLLNKKEVLLNPLIDALIEAKEKISPCKHCGNLDETNPCSICNDKSRDDKTICVVKDVMSLWVIEKTGEYKGKYFILNDSILKKYGDNLESVVGNLKKLIESRGVDEIIFAMPLNIDGKTMQYFIMQELGDKVKYCELAHGVPIGSDLEYIDEGTLQSALSNRKSIN